MKKQPVLEEIEKVIETLAFQDQLRLVEKLTLRLRQTEYSKKRQLDWSDLYGLGKGLWESEDAQDYVNRHREDRS